jgi:hypothetical protein
VVSSLLRGFDAVAKKTITLSVFLNGPARS